MALHSEVCSRCRWCGAEDMAHSCQFAFKLNIMWLESSLKV